MDPAKAVVLLVACLGLLPSQVLADGRVELEVYTEERVPLTGQQEWLQRLAQAGVSRLRIRAKQAGDKVGVEVRGAPASPIYLVTGAIDSRNDLVLPGGRYSLREAGRAAQWLAELARKGPEPKPEEQSAFGLSREQFEALRLALARPVGFSTKGAKRAELIQRLARQVGLPVQIQPGLIEAAAEDEVFEELSGLSLGTALACVLRPAGLCLVPRRTAPGALECAILPSRAGLEIWPIGWQPEKPVRDLVPAWYESFNANIQGVPLWTVLEALRKRLKVPFLLDHNAMARHGIDPHKTLINVPQSRTSYSQLVRRVLSQAKLRSELRVDEAGKPLFWVTTLRPL